MARIRTIKPEFPHSESVGRISRDARLLFIQLWTICDDSGRARASSRMLASLLFPYDDDAPSLISGWLDELESEGCIRRYTHGGQSYLDIPNWLNHQKIDKPSASKFPSFDESSRVVGESSRKIVQDQGPRTKDQGEESATPAEPQPASPPAGKAKAVTLETWLSRFSDDDTIIGTDDPIYAWAASVGLSADMLELAWGAFIERYSDKPKRYTDWKAVFRNAVRENWLKLWYIRDGQYLLTTVGEQARRAAA